MTNIKVKENQKPWVDVIGYSGIYEVSDKGEVRSKDRHIKWRGTDRFTKGQLLNPTKDTSGYLHVSLCNEGNKSNVVVHKIVADAYLGSHPDGYEINHKDGDKLNNCACNLEYVTRQRNIEHFCAKHYTLKNPSGEKVTLYNLTAFCRDNGLDQGAMCNVALGNINSYKGWTKWK